MSSWQLILLQSKANNGVYDDGAPAYYWAWPRDTWFQQRLRYLRENRRPERQRQLADLDQRR